MCQFASAYPLEIPNKMVEVNRLLQNPTLEHVLNQTKEFNQLVQEPLALIEFAENQRDIIVQQPLAQLGDITETLSTIYDSDIRKIEEVFKQSPIVRTNWASHVILLNTKLPLGERYWYTRGRLLMVGVVMLD